MAPERAAAGAAPGCARSRTARRRRRPRRAGRRGRAWPAGGPPGPCRPSRGRRGAARRGGARRAPRTRRGRRRGRQSRVRRRRRRRAGWPSRHSAAVLAGGYPAPAIMARRMKRLLILGATGSIGLQALDVVGRARGEFELVGLSAERSHERLVTLAEEHGVDRVALGDADAAARAAEAWTGGEVLAGPEGLVRLVA